jgi:hypothetical protein
MTFIEAVDGNLPGAELRVHILVERELHLVDEPHGADSGDEFRQRCRLIERLGRRALAISACECNPVPIDQRQTDRRDIERRHGLGERKACRDTADLDFEIALELGRFGGKARRRDDSGQRKLKGERQDEARAPPFRCAHSALLKRSLPSRARA